MNKILRTIIIALFPLVSMGTLTVNNGGGATNITSTSAWITASVISTGAANPNLSSYWGTNSGGTNATSWMYTNAYGVCTQGSYSFQATGLSGSTIYYFRTRATNSSESAWATYSGQFITLTTPTTAPSPSVQSLTIDTNDVIKHGTNFFTANSGLLANAVGSILVTNISYGTTAGSTYRGDWGAAVSNTADAGKAVADSAAVTATGAYNIASGLNTRSNAWDGASSTSVAAKAIADGLNTRSNAWDTGSALGLTAVQDGDTLITGLKGPSAIATNDYATWDDVLKTIGGVNTLYASTNTEMGIAGYYDARTFVPTHAASTISVAVTGVNHYVAKWISNTNIITRINKGTALITGRMRRNGGSALTVQPEMYIRYADTTEPELFDGGQPQILSATLATYLMSIDCSSNVQVPSDARLVVKYKVTTTTGNPNWEFECGSNLLNKVDLPSISVVQDSDVTALQLRTNVWDGAAVTATGAYNIASGLNTRSNTWDANDITKWSGSQATQRAFWVSHTAGVTNLFIGESTGGYAYAVMGNYTQIENQVNGYPTWGSSNGYWCAHGDIAYYYLTSDTNGIFSGTAPYYISETSPAGQYAINPGYTGAAPYVYFDTTWQVGSITGGNFQLLRNGIEYSSQSATSMFFKSFLIGNGAGLTGLVEAVADGLNTRSSAWDLATANLPGVSNQADAAKAIADGLNTKSNAWNTAAAIAAGLDTRSNNFNQAYLQSIGLDSKSNTWSGTEGTATGAYDIATGLETRSNVWDGAAVTATGAYNIATGLNSQSNQWHVSSTSLFAGADTTGAVKSAAADATKYLKGDGTWGTPAGAGDFKADGSVPMTGTLLTTNITIRGGASPGYRLTATNTAGETGWKRGRTSFLATNITAIHISADTISNINFISVVTNDGLTYASGVLTLPLGHWLIGGTVSMATPTSGNGGTRALIIKNGDIIYFGTAVPATDYIGYYQMATVSSPVFSDGNDEVSIGQQAMTLPVTNIVDSAFVRNVFWAEYLGE